MDFSAEFLAAHDYWSGLPISWPCYDEFLLSLDGTSLYCDKYPADSSILQMVQVPTSTHAGPPAKKTRIEEVDCNVAGDSGAVEDYHGHDENASQGASRDAEDVLSSITVAESSLEISALGSAPVMYRDQSLPVLLPEDGSKGYRCGHDGCSCQVYFDSLKELYRHQASTHTKASHRQCPWCDKTFCRADSLKRHLLSKQKCADFVLRLVNLYIYLDIPFGTPVEYVPRIDALSPEVHFQYFVPLVATSKK